jgi:3-phosphoshikimate 1-carboxyvinyltransferase
MLRGFGYELESLDGATRLRGRGELRGCEIDIPADISSAAFLLVAASIAPGSELLLTHVGVNPTRTGVISILRLMGADITLSNEREIGGEPVADILVRSAALRGIDIPRDLVPLAIDEFPVLFIAAACAEGRTVLRGAEELRVKESDRIASMAEGLTTLGISNEVLDDGIIIEGGTLSGGTIRTFHDHRIAMSFAVAALRSEAQIRILDCDHVATSFPGFDSLTRGLGLQIAARDAGE